jgi:hypothetical protein
MFPTEKLLFLTESKYACEKCDYKTSKKSSWDKHLLTAKHNFNQLSTSYIICKNCNKKYKDKSGLWYHAKRCKNPEENMTLDMSNNLIIEMVKQNQEFKELIIEQNKQIMEQYKDSQETNHKLLELAKEGKTINNNVTNNNKFNLQIFLNEQCKDALNIMDFVNSLKVSLTDLEAVGKLGYTEGISRIFIRGLKELDIFKRPIHCSDLKREAMYVRDKDTWEKENEKKQKLKLAINYIAHQNIVQIPIWIGKNPDAMDCETTKHTEYMRLITESMGGSTDEETENNYNKIIKNMAKEVLIDK